MGIGLETGQIAAQREDYRSVYDTGLSKLLSAIWGGSLHLGLFAHPDEPLSAAQTRVKDLMAALAMLKPGDSVIEVACGVGGTALHLARNRGVSVHGTNISQEQIDEARAAAASAGLSDRVTFGFADFHELPVGDSQFDCWWCQEALLYAVDKRRVLEEALRVTRPGGCIVFTDLLLSRTMPDEKRAEFTSMLKAPDMWAIEDWDGLLADIGLELRVRKDLSEHAAPTFAAVSKRFAEVQAQFLDLLGREAVEATEQRLRVQHKVAEAGHLGWCLYVLAV